MFFSPLRSFRKFVRRNFKNMNEDKARKWKERLAIVYFLSAWNVLGILVYNMHKGKKSAPEALGDRDSDEKPAVEWAKFLNLEGTIKVFSITGTSVDSQYEFQRHDGKVVGLQKKIYLKKLEEKKKKEEEEALKLKNEINPL